MALKFYTSVAKGLKLKVRNFGGLIPVFSEVTGENLVGVLLVYFDLKPVLKSFMFYTCFDSEIKWNK